MEEKRRELCRARDEAEAVSKAELNNLKWSIDAIRTSTQQINRYNVMHVYCIVLYVDRYVSDGGEAGLRQLNARIDAIKKEVGEKAEERKSLEERMKQLQKQVADVKVCTYYVNLCEYTVVCG